MQLQKRKTRLCNFLKIFRVNKLLGPKQENLNKRVFPKANKASFCVFTVVNLAPSFQFYRLPTVYGKCKDIDAVKLDMFNFI